MTNVAKQNGRSERKEEAACTGGMILLRSLSLALVAIGCSRAEAQPGLRALQVSFVLYNDGELVPPTELQGNSEFVFEMEGERVQPGTYGGEGFSYVEFDEWRSDRMMHQDTLWMSIVRRGQRMLIGFPPRRPPQAIEYTANFLRIEFNPARYMVTDILKHVRVKGVIRNLESIAKGNPYFDVQVHNGTSWGYSGTFYRSTGTLDATLPCTTIFEDREEWVDLTLVAQNGYGTPNNAMVIRTRMNAVVDLGTFDLVGSRFRFDRSMAIETTLPRDTIIRGSTEWLDVRMHPVNPRPTDTLAIELRWVGSGAPYVSSCTLVKRKDITDVRFSFALRTDVDVAADSWTEQARPFELPQLPAGRYVLTQEAITGHDIRSLDFLIGREIPFSVVERQ